MINLIYALSNKGKKMRGKTPKRALFYPLDYMIVIRAYYYGRSSYDSAI